MRPVRLPLKRKGVVLFGAFVVFACTCLMFGRWRNARTEPISAHLRGDNPASLDLGGNNKTKDYLRRFNLTSKSTTKPVTNIDTTNIETFTTSYPKIIYFHQPIIPFMEKCNLKECNGRKEAAWHLVVFVKSTTTNFARRELIRRTWGSWSFVENGFIAVVFVIGKSDSPRTIDLLREESFRNRDILNYDGPDDYRNIAQKTLAGMRWASEYLPDHYLYSSADDDFLVDLGALQETLVENENKFGVNSTNGFPIICFYRILDKGKPYRHKKSKWFLSKEEYPSDTFPRCCLGGWYTTSVGLARRLLNVSRDFTPMRVDDVWITGILRENISIPETMVIKPSRYAALHYTGFKGKPARTIRDFMSADWIKIYNKFRNKKLCVCNY